MRDRLTKDFNSNLRTMRKRHDEAMQAAQAEREAMQAEWKKERRDMREKLRGELQTQVAIGDCSVLVHACPVIYCGGI